MTTTATDVVTAAGGVDPTVGQKTGTESSLSTWAGDYVTGMLGKGQALANQPYQAYTGPLTAGTSNLQQQAFQGIGALQPTTAMGGSFTDTGVAQQYMNPYLQQALQPQIDEATRQFQIQQLANNARLTKAGAYGGTRGTLADLELQRANLANLANITGQGYRDAYNAAQQQFNTEQQQGMNILDKQMAAGQTQRGIASEGIAADLAQFEEERDFPYKQVQYQQSLLQGLPIAAQSYSYTEPSTLSNFLSSTGGIMQLYDLMSGGGE